MRTIGIQTLEILFSKTISKLRQEGHDKISIKEDLYRFIPTDEWSNYDEDVILTGSLFDDLDSLNQLASDSQRAMMYIDFDRIATMLRAISEELNPAL